MVPLASQPHPSFRNRRHRRLLQLARGFSFSEKIDTLVARLIRSTNNQRGYTLVEMISVMAIISVLSALVVANTSVGDKRQQLRDAVAGYVTAVKQAESLAASNQSVRDKDASTNTPTTPRLAYGVCLTSQAAGGGTPRCQAVGPGQTVDTYQIYARRLTDRNYTVRPDQPDIITSFQIPRNVSFQAAGGAIWVDYLPPTPSMLVNGLTTGSETLVTATVTGRTDYTRSAGLRPAAGAIYVK